MSFSFGAPAAGAPPSAPAPAGGGGFSFGGGGGFGFGSSAPAPGAPAPASTGFSFGGGAPAPAPGGPAPAPTTGFGFGSTTSSNNPAPSTGFGFGGAPAAAPTSSGFGAPAATAATGFGFGAPTPAPGSFSFSSSQSATSFTNPQQQQQQQQQHPVVDVSSISEAPLLAQQSWKLLKTLAACSLQSSDSGRLAGQELVQYVQSKSREMATPLVAAFETPNQNNVRGQLQQNPLVKLPGKDVVLTQHTLTDIFTISDDLRVSESTALSLYAQAQDPSIRSDILQLISTTAATTFNTDQPVQDLSIVQAARELYFQQYALPLQALLMLVQYRLSDASDPFILHATDALIQVGLIRNLFQYIEQTTNRIQQLVQELSLLDDKSSNATSATMMMMTDQQHHQEQQASATLMHLKFWTLQRQIAVEILFFVAYYVQWTGEEVAKLVTLIKNLSNQLHLWDPLHDIPSIYHQSYAQQHQQQQYQATTFFSSHQPFGAAAKKEKSEWEWQEELVQDVWATGEPHLLRCVSTLVVTFLSALETKEVLMDRDTHEPNDFGAGNALLPPGTSSTADLTPFHNSLTKAAASEWTHPDILGVLMASYALLLRSAPASLVSPRAGGVNSFTATSTVDLRKSWRDCLEAPVELKSFTFARLCLIPALQKPSRQIGPECETHEFFLSVLSQFGAQYMDVLSSSGDRPISRAMWKKDAEQDLELRRSSLEQQREFQASFRTRNVEMENIPASVNLMDRPDCMEDVVAFAITLCHLGSSYAMHFWTTKIDNKDNSSAIVPSRALYELERQKDEDTTLEPCYFSFLAALAGANDSALVQNGAEAVHALVSNLPNGWASSIGILRYYARALNPETYGNVASSSKVSSGTQASSSRAYYYEGDTNAQNWTSSIKKEEEKKPKTRELGEQNTNILMSHLNLMTNAAENSVAARLAILSISLATDDSVPIAESSEIETSTMILFTLAMMPLKPEVRGAVFRTIAALLRVDGATSEEKGKLVDFATKAWELLEVCQILPIYLFEQFPSVQESDMRNIARMGFPPSTTPPSTNTGANNWIPPDPMYSIVYEMEYVESSSGAYPSTEGFCHLLQTLFQSAGSPMDLGRNWRSRGGSTPYLEYAMSLVLPRATGHFQGLRLLPFRSDQDKYRLICAALSVVEAASFPYLIPTTLVPAQKAGIKDACELAIAATIEKLGDSSFSKSLVHFYAGKDTAVVPGDFDQPKSAQPVGIDGSSSAMNPRPSDQSSLIPISGTMAPLPRLMSPGFSSLVSVLSSSGSGYLFKSIMSILIHEKGIDSVGEEADLISLCFALYKHVPPTYESARNISKGKTSLTSYERLLKTLTHDSDPYCYRLAAQWRSKSISSALKILCFAVSREDLFLGAVESVSSLNSIVPSLRFEKKVASSSRLNVFSLELSKTAKLLLTENMRNGILRAIVSMLSCSSLYRKFDTEISTAAVSLLFYIDSTLSRGQSIAEVYQTIQFGKETIARNFGKRLLRSFRDNSSEPDKDVVRLILNHILDCLRRQDIVDGSLDSIVMGLGSFSENSDWTINQTIADCFDATVQILEDATLTARDACPDLLSRAYEIMYRLYSLSGDFISFAVAASTRLRSIDFLLSHLSLSIERLKFSETCCSNGEYVQSLSWLLKCSAHEIEFLAGRLPGGAPLPDQLSKLLSFLLSSQEGVLFQCIVVLPVEKEQFESFTACPSEHAIRSSQKSLSGAPEVVQGYEMIDIARFEDTSKDQVDQEKMDEMKSWCNKWNLSVIKNCVSAHLSSAIHMILGTLSLVANDPIYSQSSYEYLGHQLLASILDRITNRLRDNLHPMDSLYYTTATRNLSVSALVAANLTGDTGSPIDPFSASRTLALVGRALASSALVSRAAGAETGLRDQRTAILSSVFQTLLQHASDADGLHGEAMNAATALARIAFRAPLATPSFPDTGIQIARSCLILLLKVMQSDGIENSFLEVLFKDPILEYGDGTISDAAVRLVAALDNNVCDFLTSICQFSESPRVLDESKVLEALATAAVLYKAEETKALTALRSSYSRYELRVPDFLHGHILLMNSLLATPLSDARRRDAATKVLNIMNSYDTLLRQVFSRFPVDGDLILAVFQCICQSRSILRSSSNGTLPTYSKSSNDFEKAVISLTLHIAENPLPQYLMPSLPGHIGRSEIQESIMVQPVSDGKSWWDDLSLKFTRPPGRVWQPSTPPEVYAISNSAFDMILCGLSLLRDEHQSDTIHLEALVCGMCRCVDAIKVIETSMQVSSSESNSGAEEAKVKLMDIITDILSFVVQKTRRLKERESESLDRGAGFREIVLSALDYTRLDKVQLATLTQSDVDENRHDTVLDLGKTLRSELLGTYIS